MKTHILALNAGSSSIKFTVFDFHNSLQEIMKGEINRIGLNQSHFRWETKSQSKKISYPVTAQNHTEAANILLDFLIEQKMQDTFLAVGHRVVHGGSQYYQPTRVSAELLTDLRKLSPIDSEHMPQEILIIESIQRRFSDLPQLVCFDTAFHHNLPRIVQLLPIPRKYEAVGVRKFGFHGLSYEYLLAELAHLNGEVAANARIIFAHLGSGASLAAVHEKKPMDTSMSFTPTSGVLMGTRSGDLDPGISSYLARTQNLDAKAFNEMVNFHSGLMGISETSSDMQDLLKIESQDVRAKEAISLFCYEIKKRIGAFAAALGGLDTLVFTGGIGENAPAVRARISDDLNFLGIELDITKNEKNERVISKPQSRVEVMVVHTNEELMIARHVCKYLSLSEKKEI